MCCCAAVSLLVTTPAAPAFAQNNEYTFELGFPTDTTARDAKGSSYGRGSKSHRQFTISTLRETR